MVDDGPGHDEAPAEISAGARVCSDDALMGHVGWSLGWDPFRTSLVRSRPVAHPHRSALDGRSQWCVHLTSLGHPVRDVESRCTSGAAGSRTRVPRSRSAGLYVRRFRMFSGTVLRSQTASVSHTTVRCSPWPGGHVRGVEPRYVDPTLLRGVRGGSSQVFKLRWQPQRFRRLLVPTRFVEVA